MRLKKLNLLIVTLVVVACLVSIFEIPTYAAGTNMNNAEQIYPGTTVKSNYAGNYASDYYKLVLSKSGKVSIDFASKDHGMDISLLKPDGTKVDTKYSFHDKNQDVYSAYILTYVDAGTYYVLVDDGYYSSPYSVKVDYNATTESFPESLTDRNDYLNEAKKISLNKTITGIMANKDSSGQDFYKFSLTSKTDIKITSRTDNDISGYYSILDSDGKEVTGWSNKYDSNLGYCRCTDKQVTLPKGSYYLKVERPVSGHGFVYKVNMKADIKISSISLSRTSLTLDMEGTKTATLKATVSPSTASNKNLKWTSTNSSVAKVSSDGKVTAVSAGTVTISAKATDGSGKVASCKVTVKGTSGVTYSTHVQSYGWQSWKNNGAMAGTSGEAKRLEGIKIKLTDKRYAGGIRYTTHVQTYGWLGDQSNSASWAHDGQMSGTTGEGKRLEAIKIKLYGDMAKNYDVYYRVHAQSYGWLGWAKNGAPSGTAGKGKRLEAIQIVLVKKGGKAPANTYKGVTSNTSTAYIQ